MQTTAVIAATARLLGQHHWIKGRRHFRHVHALKSDYEFQLMALYGDANCVYLMDTLTSLRNETQKLKCKLLEANVIRRPKVEPKNAGRLGKRPQNYIHFPPIDVCGNLVEAGKTSPWS